MVSLNDIPISATSFDSASRPWARFEVDADNATEALRKAGLDWEVKTEDVKSEYGVVIPNVKATVRTDLPEESPDRVLGIVGDRYQPIQNSDALGFVDDLLAKGGRITHAGPIDNGKRVWMRLQMGDEFGINGDAYTRQLLAFTGHDGYCMRSLQAMMLRLICLNGMMAISNIAKWTVRHTRYASERVAESNELIMGAEQEWEQLTSKLRSLIGQPVYARQYLESVVPPTYIVDKATGLRKIASRGENIRNRILDRLESSPALEGHRGDLYGAYQAVAEYADHDRVMAVNPDKRLKNLWFGGANQLKTKALNKALDLVAV